MNKTINCILVDDEPVARDILEAYIQKIPNFHIAGSCKNALEAFQVLSNTSVDLIFLDINMPEISGLSFAKSINKSVKIIFTTAYREYAIDGFDLKAVDYLLKPISFERFLQAIGKYADEQIQSNQPESPTLATEATDFFFVRSDRKMIRINFSDIIYIESLSDYIQLTLPDKTITTRDTITSIEAKLPKKQFIRTHRSFIVPINRIESYTNEFVEIGSKMIPISRSYKNEVLEQLNYT